MTDEQLDFRLHIHESADEPTARLWWSEVVGHPLDRFSRSTIKRHNPTTPRRNVGPEYRGCPCVTVRASGMLYDTLRGVVLGLTGNERRQTGWHDEPDDPLVRWQGFGTQPGGEVPSALV